MPAVREGFLRRSIVRLSEFYRSSQPDISFELFPPKTEKGIEEMFAEVEALRTHKPAFFSMTYGAGGSTRERTLGLAAKLKNEIGVEVMCHLTVVGQSKEGTRSALRFLKEKRIYNLIALRGDPPQGTEGFQPYADGFRYAGELVAEARSMNYFSIAVAGFPEMHPDSPDQTSDIVYLKKKVDAGADVVITQLFFDNRDFYRYVELVRKAGVRVPVIPGILPIASVAQVRRFTALSKSKIPPALNKQLEKYEYDPEGATRLGIDYAWKQCEDLVKNGVCGIHFYCLNKSKSVREVLKHLGR